MVRYANPTQCPDCLAPLPASPTACPACHLPLVGQTAADLFTTLQQADRLLVDLRAADRPATATPTYDVPAAALRPEARLSAASVPRILLGLGVLCLLVAAITFLVVTWSWLGVGGRTTVLVLLTLASGALSTWLDRRGLRLAGEALAVVAFGLLVLDLVGADDAGWLGSLSGAGLLSVVGAVVGGTGLVISLAQRDLPEPMISPQVFGALGVWAVPVGIGIDSDHLAVVAAIAAAGLLALAAGARSLRLRWLTALLALAAASWWLTLLVIGAVRALDHATLGALVRDGHAWPMAVAALLLVVAALLVRDRPPMAAVLLGGAGLVASALALVPAADNDGADLGLVLAALLALGAVAMPLVARPWRSAVEVPVAMLGLAGLGLVAEWSATAIRVVAYGAEVAWSQGWSAEVPMPPHLATPSLPAPVLLPIVAALLLAGMTWRRTMAQTARSARTYAVPVVAVLSLTTAVVALLEALPSALVLAIVLLGAAALGAWAEPRDDRPGVLGLAGAAALTGLGLVVALPSVVLTAVSLALVCAATGALLVRDRRADRTLAWAAGAVLPGALAGLVWSLAEIGSVPEVWRAAPVLLLLGALALVRPLPAIEISAAFFGSAAAVASVEAAAERPTALAVYLTLAGALVVATSLVHEHRRYLGWLGGLLLAAATWVRLWDLGVDAPEAYTLPSAVALLLVGLRHLAKHPDAGTGRALAPGLVLATVPSLLRVMVEDPVSLRAGLLGLACLGLVLAGATLRWQAPLLVGGAVGAVLVLREWAPYAGIVPPWVWIAAAGTTLLVVGVTWERRLQDLRGGATYLARLR